MIILDIIVDEPVVAGQRPRSAVDFEKKEVSIGLRGDHMAGPASDSLAQDLGRAEYQGVYIVRQNGIDPAQF